MIALLFVGFTASGSIALDVTVTDITRSFFSGAGIFYNGSIIVKTLGGTAPYHFVMSSGQESVNGYFTDLAPGDYSITVTDAAGEAATNKATISSVYPLPGIVFTNAVIPSSCNSTDGSFTVMGTGGTPPYTYSIDGNKTFTPNNTFSNLRVGYYPAVLVKDAHGLLAQTRTQMQGFNSELDKPYFFRYDCEFDVHPNGVLASECTHPGSVSGYINNGNLPIEFSLDGIAYYPGVTTEFFPGVRTYYSFENLPAGLYTIYARDAIGTVAAASITITELCILNITSVSAAATCHANNGTVTITPNNGIPPYSYTIDGLHYQSGNVFTGLFAGIYTISAKDAIGEETSITTIVPDNCPQLSLTSTNETCNTANAAITATGSGGTAPYKFSIDGTNFQTSNVFTGLKAGNFTVTIKDANNFTQTTNVTIINNCLQVTATAASSTCGQPNGTITATASGGALPYQYSLDATIYQFENTFSGLKAGSYTVSIKDATGTISTANTVVAGIPASVVNLGNDTTLCPGATLLLAPVVKATNVSYTWQDGSANSSYVVSTEGQYSLSVVADGCTITDAIQVNYLQFSNNIFTTHDTTLCQGISLLLNAGNTGAMYAWDNGSTAETRTVNTAGKYWVTLGMNGCSAAASDTVYVHYTMPPVVALGNDTTLCNGSNWTINKAGIHGTYLWSNGATGFSININKAGLYWLVVSDKGCAKADSINVFYKPNPMINLGTDTTLCSGQQLLLNASNANALYKWQDGSIAATYTVSKQGTYSVNVSVNGCDTTGKIMVGYTDKPVVDLGNDTTFCQYDKLQLDASFPLSTYLWQDGSTGPIYTVTKSGTYIVHVANNCGEAQDAVAINYKQCTCMFYLPSAFTPNNDGKNDIFKPVYRCSLSNYLLKVYNRWGKLVFTSNEPTVGWYGYTNSIVNDVGTYVWIVNYKDNISGKTINKNGTILLMQ